MRVSFYVVPSALNFTSSDVIITHVFPACSTTVVSSCFLHDTSQRCLHDGRFVAVFLVQTCR